MISQDLGKRSADQLPTVVEGEPSSHLLVFVGDGPASHLPMERQGELPGRLQETTQSELIGHLLPEDSSMIYTDDLNVNLDACQKLEKLNVKEEDAITEANSQDLILKRDTYQDFENDSRILRFLEPISDSHSDAQEVLDLDPVITKARVFFL